MSAPGQITFLAPVASDSETKARPLHARLVFMPALEITLVDSASTQSLNWDWESKEKPSDEKSSDKVICDRSNQVIVLTRGKEAPITYKINSELLKSFLAVIKKCSALTKDQQKEKLIPEIEKLFQAGKTFHNQNEVITFPLVTCKDKAKWPDIAKQFKKIAESEKYKLEVVDFYSDRNCKLNGDHNDDQFFLTFAKDSDLKTIRKFTWACLRLLCEEHAFDPKKSPIGYLALVFIKNPIFMDLWKELFDGAFKERLGIFEKGAELAVNELARAAPSGFDLLSLIEAIKRDVKMESLLHPTKIDKLFLEDKTFHAKMDESFQEDKIFYQDRIEITFPLVTCKNKAVHLPDIAKQFKQIASEYKLEIPDCNNDYNRNYLFLTFPEDSDLKTIRKFTWACLRLFCKNYAFDPEKFPIGYLAFVLIKNHVFMDLLKELFDGAFEEKLGIFENGVTAAVTKLMKVAPSGFSSPSLIEAICQDVRAEAEVPPGSVMAKTISAMVKYALVTMSGRAALQQSDLPPHVGIAPFEARKSTP